jgi:hypothetical protein
LTPFALSKLQNRTSLLGILATEIKSEVCFNIELTAALDEHEWSILEWLLAETFEPLNLSRLSFLQEVRVD